MFGRRARTLSTCQGVPGVPGVRRRSFTRGRTKALARVAGVQPQKIAPAISRRFHRVGSIWPRALMSESASQATATKAPQANAARRATISRPRRAGVTNPAGLPRAVAGRRLLPRGR